MWTSCALLGALLTLAAARPSSVDRVFGRPDFADEVAIVVPSTIADERINSTALGAGIARMLADLTGGATATRGRGWYASVSDGLIEEDVNLIVSSTNLSLDILDQLKLIADWLKRQMCQEAVMVKINGAAFLIYLFDWWSELNK